MKTNMKQVQDLLILYVNDYYAKRQEITFLLKDKISLRKINGLFNRTLIIDVFSQNELYFFTKMFYQVAESDDKAPVNPENFFTPLEITEYESTTIKIDNNEKNNTIILHNVYETEKDKIWYCIKGTYMDFVTPFENNLIGYDKRMQRETEKINVFNKIVERPKVYMENVRSMIQSMKKGIFIPDPITINILKDGNAIFEYDEENHTLTITATTKSLVFLIDGIHRVLAMMSSVQEDPKCAKNTMTAMIFHKTIAESQQWINQQNQRTPVSKEKLATFNIENPTMLIAKEINDYETEVSNSLFDKLAYEYKDVQLLEKYCTLNTFANAIESNFVIKTKRDSRLIIDYLVKFFNELLSVFDEDLKNLKQSRIDSSKLYNYSFAGYVALASILYKEKDWITILDCILEETDWNFNNPIWKKLRLTQEDLKPQPLKDIYKYFKEMAKGLIEEDIVEEVIENKEVENNEDVNKEKEMVTS